tara:strand:- start:149 stop:274 length:126 start_codon:yes stop_codon:yes gene_type:complete
MFKVTLSKLEKNHPIFTGRFATYTPISLKKKQKKRKDRRKK